MAEHFQNAFAVIAKAHAFPEKNLEIVLMLNDQPSEYDVVLPFTEVTQQVLTRAKNLSEGAKEKPYHKPE